MNRSLGLVNWIAALALAGSAATAAAQTFYKWTDDRGVVHFADTAPPQPKGVEERNLPPPAAKLQRVEPDAAAHAPDDAAKAAGVDTAGNEGPARVIIVTRKTPRTGPSAMQVQGEVKNVGGVDARSVSVTISALDSGQGNPCLQQETAVLPDTLSPGQTGKFDLDIDSPCLNDNDKVDVTPTWD